MKEFLNPNNGYEFIELGGTFCVPECWIEVPDGAEIAIKFNDDVEGFGVIFYKNNGKSSKSEGDENWKHGSTWTIEDLLNEDYVEDGIDLSHKVLWQREKESLNDKVASAEEFRKQSVVDLPEFKHDVVNHPSHYTSGDIECIDAIKASMSIEAFAGFLKGNIIKYMWRYEHKNGVEDLKKAQWYQNKLIELLG